MPRRTIEEGPGGTQATHSAVDNEAYSGPGNGEPETRENGAGSAEQEGILGVARARIQARANRAVDMSTDYFRTHDLDEMRGDLEREIRSHPIRSVALALGAGYVLGKLFR